jgi:hypothetical protein
MKYTLYLIFSVLVLTGCKKDLSLEGREVVIPQVPEPPVEKVPKFQLKAFYSDIAIDFDLSDHVVKSETDLFAYVYDYLKDDYYTFLDEGKLQIDQNEKKMPGLNDDIVYRQYFFGKDEIGDYLTFLSATYEQVNYRLIERTDDYFVLGLSWKDGAHVYSRFERVD